MSNYEEHPAEEEIDERIAEFLEARAVEHNEVLKWEQYRESGEKAEKLLPSLY